MPTRKPPDDSAPKPPKKRKGPAVGSKRPSLADFPKPPNPLVHRGVETTCSREVLKQFEDLLTAGNYFDTVTGYLGIAPSTSYGWREKGEAGQLAEGADPAIWVDFAETCARAEHRAEVTAAAILRQHGQDHRTRAGTQTVTETAPDGTTRTYQEEWVPGDWRAIAEFMARRYPKRWSKAERVSQELTGANGGPVEVAHSGRLDLTGEAAIAVVQFHEQQAEAGEENGNAEGQPEVDAVQPAPTAPEAGGLPEPGV